MTRQIARSVGFPSAPQLEDRILQLETKVALLTSAVEVMTSRLDELSDTPPVSPAPS